MADARTLLSACCGSRAGSIECWHGDRSASRIGLLTAAREEWDALEPRDWLEAFGHHPKIGDRASLVSDSRQLTNCRRRNRQASTGASDAILDALADGNRAYEDGFGYIFIVCATGKSAEAMLALLRERLSNQPDDELRIAAGEQAKITALELDALRLIES